MFVAVGLLAGCTPQTVDAEPAPAFTSDAEAFAAAEATYRAYVDALNDVDLSDPETFEAVYAWTTGEANAEARTRFSEMHASGWTVDGGSLARTVELASVDSDTVALNVCLDVSGVTLVDADGTSVVSDDRPDVQSMLVTLHLTGTSSTGLLIADFSGRDGGPTCG